jgi:hypothetical protein
MTSSDPPISEETLDRVGELQEADRVGHRGAATADPAGHFFLGESELLGELLIGGSLLENTEVLTMEVLDQGLLEGPDVLSRAHNGRNGLETRSLGRPPPAFPGDQFELLGRYFAHENRLEHTDRLDRGRQTSERIIVEEGTRLIGVGFDLSDGELPELGVALLQLFCCGDEGTESPTESALACHR